jgi:hypothetical protein
VYTLQAFLDGKFVVVFSNESDRIECLRILEDKGLLWNSGSLPTELSYSSVCFSTKYKRLVCGNSMLPYIPYSQCEFNSSFVPFSEVEYEKLMDF